MTTPSELGALRAENVDFAYGGVEVLRQVSLSLSEGDVVALAGPNGSGKTTLLSLLSGLHRPAGGEVTLNGDPLRRLSPRRRARSIAAVPQRIDPRLAFSVRQMVLLGRTPHTGFLGNSGPADERAVDAALRSTDMLAMANRRYSELSSGEQQRVAIAMALAQEARYLLLDEPTVHLDLQHQHELLELIRTLHKERGVAILAVMHDLNLAALFFDRIALLDRGRLIADAAGSEVMRRPELLALFRAPLAVVTHPSAGVPQVLLERGR